MAPLARYAASMRSLRILILVLPVMLLGCNRASWGSSSGGSAYYDPDSPDFEVQDSETGGSYTPIQASDEGDDD